MVELGLLEISRQTVAASDNEMRGKPAAERRIDHTAALQLLPEDRVDKPTRPNPTKPGSVSGKDADVEKTEENQEVVELMPPGRVGFEYKVDKELGRVSLKVYDKETGETIREVPPEELTEVAKKMKKMAGILFEKKV